ncbi:hypothetical protein ACFLWW_02380 [Chloroflexota bacterium]
MEDLRKLKGGAKHKYLREHRREILGYLGTHGEFKTLKKYGMTIDTLDRLVRDNSVTRQQRINDIDRVVLRVDILQEAVNGLNRDMRALENSYKVPVEELADNIRNYIVIPLLKMAQQPDRFEDMRAERLLDIGDMFEEVERK